MYKVFPHIKTVESRQLQKRAAEMMHGEASIEPTKSQARRRSAKQRISPETPDPLTQTLWAKGTDDILSIAVHRINRIMVRDRFFDLLRRDFTNLAPEILDNSQAMAQ
jgi:hypothetical protein